MTKKIFILHVCIALSSALLAQTWSPLTIGTTADVMGISFPSTDTGFAKLGNGTMRKTYDGGTSWTNVNLHDASVGDHLEFISSAKGFMLDDSGIVVTNNGGASWSFCCLHPELIWIDIFFYDASVGYASSITMTYDTFFVYKTLDGGATWNACTPIQDFNAMYPILFFRTQTEGYLAGSDQIHKTTDGGVTWNSVYTAPNIDLIGTITAPDATNAYCGTQYYMDIVKSSNGGNNWASTSQSLGSPAYDSHFLNGATGFICGGSGINSGYITKTVNGGSSWIQDFTGTQTMLCMDFPSGTVGYCGGTGGLLLKYSVPTSALDMRTSVPLLFPNPVSNVLNVCSLSSESVVTVRNKLGQVMFTQTSANDQLQIDVSNFPTGTYFIQVCDENSFWITPFQRM